MIKKEKKRMYIILLSIVVFLTMACGEKPVARKPVIYLYPERITTVNVQLELKGKLECTYPDYRDGWTVEAHPDGKLKTADGREFNYLFWEGSSDFEFHPKQGFVVAGRDTAAFLEEKLPLLGLNPQEANEFIVYWLPLMQNNPYNLIVFEGEEYSKRAVLKVNPAPDTVIRISMAWKALDEQIEIEPQVFVKPERKGFVLVEWGGREIK